MKRLASILGAGDEQTPEVLVLLVILACAFVLRLWGIATMEPHPDARLAVMRGMQYLGGDFNPRWFGWPGQTVMWVTTGALGLFYLAGLATGRFAGWEDFVHQYGLFPKPWYVAARVPMVLFSMGTLVLTYKISRRFLPARGALAATVFLSFSFLHSMHSQFVRPDIVGMFFLLLAIHFSYRIVETGKLSRYIAAGVSVGAGVATKWVMAPVLLSVLIAHAVRVQGERKPEEVVAPLRWTVLILAGFGIVFLLVSAVLTPAVLPGILGEAAQARTVQVLSGKLSKLAAAGGVLFLAWGIVCKVLPSLRAVSESFLRIRLLLAVIVTSAITFFVISPYTILDYKTLLRDMVFEARTEQLGAESLPFLQNVLWYIREPLGWGFGVFLLLLAVTGLVWGLSRKPKSMHLILLPFAFVYGVFLLSADLRWPRWAIHLLPFLAIYAGIGITYLVDKLTVDKRSLRSFLMSTAVIILTLFPVWRIIRYDHLISGLDTRQQFVAWAVSNLSPGERIAQEALSGDLPAGRFDVLRELARPSLAGRSLEDYRQEGWQILVVSSDFFGRYFAERDKYPKQTQFYDTLFKEGELLADFKAPDEGWPPRDERLSRYHIHFSPEIRVYRILPDGKEAGSS